MSYWILWLIIVILLTMIEAVTVNLVSIWFILSGIISLFVSLFVDSFLWQFGIFVGVGAVLMILTKPALDKMLQEKEAKTNLERIIGMEGVVTQPIKKNVVGEVKVDGKLWSAVSDVSIKVDEVIRVKELQSVKLVVEKVVNEEEKVVKKEGTSKSSSQKKSSKKSSSKKPTTTKSTTKKSTSKSNSTKKVNETKGTRGKQVSKEKKEVK